VEEEKEKTKKRDACVKVSPTFLLWDCRKLIKYLLKQRLQSSEYEAKIGVKLLNNTSEFPVISSLLSY
jgi:hypothetical protein